MAKTKHQIKDLREKITKLIAQDFSYQEIADILKLSCKQAVHYHVKMIRKQADNLPIDNGQNIV